METEGYEEVSSEEWVARVTRLVELIARKTELLRMHRNSHEPIALMIEQYEELRNRHLDELSALASRYDLEIRFRTATNNPAVQERGIAISRLLQLIEMDSEIIERHRQADQMGPYVQQYVELRQRNLETLAELIRQGGYLDGDLRIVDKAA
jgi:pyruvate-formate lyase